LAKVYKNSAIILLQLITNYFLNIYIYITIIFINPAT